MSKRITERLSRLQNQSRIPATTWRHWCNLLDLDPVDAVDVREGICHPIMVATRKVPEVPYILQMRAARLELDIFDFKEEVPKVLHITGRSKTTKAPSHCRPATNTCTPSDAPTSFSPRPPTT